MKLNNVKKTTLILFLTAICSFNYFAQIQPDGQVGFSDEEYKFWSETWCYFDDYLNDVNLKVIQTETLPMTISLEKDRSFVPKIRDYYSNGRIPDMANNLIKDFNVKNDKSYLLKRKFVGCKNYDLVSKSEILSIFEKSKDGWEEFKAKYPKSHGYFRFSRIGFSPDKKQAVIFLKYSCGSLCSSGDYYFFVKENDMWIEKIKQNFSAS